MKTFLAFLAFLGIGACVYLSFQSSGYEIVLQQAFAPIQEQDSGTKGTAVRSANELKDLLPRIGKAMAAIEAESGRTDFQTHFLLFVERGRLVEVYPGNSGFDIAAVEATASNSLALVKGPRNRPIKTVLR